MEKFHQLNQRNKLGDIDRIDYSDMESIKKLIRRNIPFVITGIGKNWPAFTRWDLDYFEQEAGHKQINYVSLDANNLTKYQKIEKASFSEFIQKIRQNISQNPIQISEKIYLVISRILAHKNRPEPQLPELSRDIEVPPFFPWRRLWTVNLWVGAGDNKSNLHFDPDHGLLIPIKGTKEFILISPDQGKFLYQNQKKDENRLQSKINVFQIDNDKYPDVDKVFYYETKIKEGEGIYTPSGWWHAVNSSSGLNIAVNFWWLSSFKVLFNFKNPVGSIQWNVKNKWISLMFPFFTSKYFKSQA